MGFFENMKKRKELQKLEQAAEESPSPQTITALAEKLYSNGEVERALEVAEQALKLFPLSDKVQTTYKFIKKQHLKAKIREITEEIKQNPNPVSYGKLAIIHKDMGDTHKAVDVCKDLEEKFPLSENSYMIIGEIRDQRFREDRLAADGMKAMQNLEHALEINAHNYKALLMLAEIYVRIGAFNRAIDRLQTIMQFAPTDDRVRKLRDESREYVNSEADESDEALEFLFMDVENRKAFLYDIREVEEGLGRLIEPAAAAPVAGEGGSPAKETLQKRLERLDKVPGFQGAVAMDREGRVLCGRVPFHVNKETFDEVVGQIYAAARAAALHMDVGDLVRAEVAGEAGQMLLQYGDGVILGVMAEAKTRPELIDQSVQRILAGVAAAT